MTRVPATRNSSQAPMIAWLGAAALVVARGNRRLSAAGPAETVET